MMAQANGFSADKKIGILSKYIMSVQYHNREKN